MRHIFVWDNTFQILARDAILRGGILKMATIKSTETCAIDTISSCAHKDQLESHSCSDHVVVRKGTPPPLAKILYLVFDAHAQTLAAAIPTECFNGAIINKYSTRRTFPRTDFVDVVLGRPLCRGSRPIEIMMYYQPLPPMFPIPTLNMGSFVLFRLLQQNVAQRRNW